MLIDLLVFIGLLELFFSIKGMAVRLVPLL